MTLHTIWAIRNGARLEYKVTSGRKGTKTILSGYMQYPDAAHKFEVVEHVREKLAKRFDWGILRRARVVLGQKKVVKIDDYYYSTI